MNVSEIPVAAVQPAAHNREDFDAMWPMILARVDAAGEGGARLIVLPEGTVPGYVLGSDPVVPEQLERAAADVCALAERHRAVIVYGGAKIVNGTVYNAAICVGPDGTEIGYAAKQFLWHFDRRWFAPGDTLQPLVTPIGVIGLLVCADGRIPTIAATLVDRGAQLLVMPTAWVTSGRDPEALENVQADLMANVRARENGVPFVVANKCGVERESVAYCGKSAIIDATGAFVARAGEREPGIVVGSVALGRGRRRVATGAPSSAGAATNVRPERARIAFTTAAAGVDGERFAAAAAVADCDLLIAREPAVRIASLPIAAIAAAAVPATHTCAGVVYAIVDDAMVHDPAALARLRLADVDLFIWDARTTGDDALWQRRFARTRAAELRVFVVVLAATGTAYAVDPDGIVIAGTFGAYRLASFVYDRARTRATLVAPGTDVLAGLRTAQSIGSREGQAARSFAE